MAAFGGDSQGFKFRRADRSPLLGCGRIMKHQTSSHFAIKTIEALGFADHIGTVTRLQVLVDLVGPIAQTIYYRDLSNLGGHFTIREEDKENVRVQ